MPACPRGWRGGSCSRGRRSRRSSARRPMAAPSHDLSGRSSRDGPLMDKDGQALLLLVGVLAVALAGIALYVSGAARRAELASRGGPDDEERGLRRIVRALDARLRRMERGRRLAS